MGKSHVIGKEVYLWRFNGRSACPRNKLIDGLLLAWMV